MLFYENFVNFDLEMVENSTFIFIYPR